jgi:hypothetical protein
MSLGLEGTRTSRWMSASRCCVLDSGQAAFGQIRPPASHNRRNAHALAKAPRRFEPDALYSDREEVSLWIVAVERQAALRLAGLPIF